MKIRYQTLTVNFFKHPSTIAQILSEEKIMILVKILIKRRKKNEPHFLKGVANGLEILYVCLVYILYLDQYQLQEMYS